MICKCSGTGFVGSVICVDHLKEAFEEAMRIKDFSLAAVIVLKESGKLCLK